MNIFILLFNTLLFLLALSFFNGISSIFAQLVFESLVTFSCFCRRLYFFWELIMLKINCTSSSFWNDKFNTFPNINQIFCAYFLFLEEHLCSFPLFPIPNCTFVNIHYIGRTYSCIIWDTIFCEMVLGTVFKLFVLTIGISSGHACTVSMAFFVALLIFFTCDNLFMTCF